MSRAIDDYVACLRAVRGVADYVAINISSPNTAGLRELHAREKLEPLLSALLQERAGRLGHEGPPLPLMLKIAPDLDTETLRSVGELRKQLGPAFPIIGVGGVDSPQAALRLRSAGADLIQLYTGLVYRGPTLVRNCVRALAGCMERTPT